MWKKLPSNEPSNRLVNKGKKCEVKSCNFNARSKGLCLYHYQKLRNGTSREALVGEKAQRRWHRGELCKEFGCHEKAKVKGYCISHYYKRRYCEKMEQKKKVRKQINRGKICKRPDCVLRARIKGYCVKHYHQEWQRKHHEKHITKSNQSIS